MNVSFEQISELVEAELARHDAPDQRTRLGAVMVTPTVIPLTWQYGEASDRFDAWLIGRSADGRIGLVYCTEGLGSGDFPWGAVLLDSGDMGMDSEWHSGLADAAIHFALIKAPLGYVVPGPRT
jgi:hypothetical protein